ncbi:RAD52 motif-containing protein 1-like isoform X2 [Dreissena polymorpha]|uniref:RAD52 motif-containing protein 1-like isoform X2 n=1 Tax=Dreissena polymorpha TaxID=45954 RepID=UPI002264276E|nr:RAD52 motif-containing protein 1-like isoform X2 [Dreissena polymorpha]
MDPSKVEIIDFYRPDGSRKNLFITNIPGCLTEDEIVYQLYGIFEPFGLLYGVQVFPCSRRFPQATESENGGAMSGSKEQEPGYYAFVTFYSTMHASRVKESMNSVIMLAGSECKIAYAKSRKQLQERHPLYVSKCYDLINYFLGFNSWSTTIKTMFEDTDSVQATPNTTYVKYVCLVELRVLDIIIEGVGVSQEALAKSSDPMLKIQAVGKCKKLCYMRAIENAFSRVLLVVLGNGKVHVEIDTTKPELRTDVVSDEQLVNELSDQPESEQDLQETHNPHMADGSMLSASGVDNLNLQILQELEEDM